MADGRSERESMMRPDANMEATGGTLALGALVRLLARQAARELLKTTDTTDRNTGDDQVDDHH